MQMMFPMYVSKLDIIYIEPQKLFCCQYFENYYLLLGQLGQLGQGGNIYAIYDQFLTSMPNQLKKRIFQKYFFHVIQ